MVDVSGKEATARTAVATGVLRTTAEVIALLRRDGLPKGDALATARIAGIMGAKRTPDLVPLCHPIALAGVTVELEPGEAEVRIRATVRTTDRTGVEMEALTAVAVAGADPARHGQGGRPRRRARRGARRAQGGRQDRHLDPPRGRARETRGTAAAVITASNRAAAGVYADRSGPVIVAWLRERGYECPEPAVVPGRRSGRRRAARRRGRRRGRGDHDRRHRHLAHRRARRRSPGRCSTTRSPASPTRSARRGAPAVPTAVLSRGLAGRRRAAPWWSTCPGRPAASGTGSTVLDGVLDHAVDQLRGGDHR